MIKISSKYILLEWKSFKAHFVSSLNLFSCLFIHVNLSLIFAILKNRDSCSCWLSCSIFSQSSHQASSDPWTFWDRTAYWHHSNPADFPSTPLTDPRTRTPHRFLPVQAQIQTGPPPPTTPPPHHAVSSGTRCLCSALRQWIPVLHLPVAAWPMAVTVCFRSL